MGATADTPPYDFYPSPFLAGGPWLNCLICLRLSAFSLYPTRRQHSMAGCTVLRPLRTSSMQTRESPSSGMYVVSRSQSHLTGINKAGGNVGKAPLFWLCIWTGCHFGKWSPGSYQKPLTQRTSSREVAHLPSAMLGHCRDPAANEPLWALCTQARLCLPTPTPGAGPESPRTSGPGCGRCTCVRAQDSKVGLA